jgi:hypothetical protein
MLAHIPWVWDWTAAGWAAGAAWATFVVAAIAAAFAGRQVLEARKTREEQAQPFVIVDFDRTEASKIHMDLVIVNTGTTLAKDVKAVFDPPLRSTLTEKDQQYDLADAAIIRRGLPTMPPGREFRLLFDSMPALYASELPRSYNAKVTFTDSRGRFHELDYRLDLDVYFGWMRIDVKGQHQATTALEKIERTLSKWTEGHRGLTVWARDGKARDEQQRLELEEHRRSHERGSDR